MGFTISFWIFIDKQEKLAYTKKIITHLIEDIKMKKLFILFIFISLKLFSIDSYSVLFDADSLEDFLLFNTNYTCRDSILYKNGFPVYRIDYSIDGFPITDRYFPSFPIQIPLISISSITSDLSITTRTTREIGKRSFLLLGMNTSDYKFSYLQEILDNNFDKESTGRAAAHPVDWNFEKLKSVELATGLSFLNNEFFFSGEIKDLNGHHPHSDRKSSYMMGRWNGLLGSFKPSIIFIHNKKTYHNYNAEWKYNPSGLPSHETSGYLLGLRLAKDINKNVTTSIIYELIRTYSKSNIFEDGSYDLNGDGVIDANDIDRIDDFADVDNDLNVEINGIEKGCDWSFLTLYPFSRTRDSNGYIIDGYGYLAWADREITFRKIQWENIIRYPLNYLSLKVGWDYCDVFDYSVFQYEGGDTYINWLGENPSILYFSLQDSLRMGICKVHANIGDEIISYREPYSYISVPFIPIVASFKTKYKNTGFSFSGGITFPVSENLKFHISLSRLSVLPPMKFKYLSSYPFPGVWVTSYTDEGIPAMKDMVFEPGLDIKLGDFLIGLKLISRSGSHYPVIRDYYSLWYPNIEKVYVDSGNYYFKGININLNGNKKLPYIDLAIGVSYTYGESKANGFYSIEKTIYSPGDRTHNLSAFLGISPCGEFEFIPDITSHIVYFSGLPYYKDNKDGSITCIRTPPVFNIDLKMERSLSLNRKCISIFFDIKNLLNRKNIVRVSDVSWYSFYDDPSGKYIDATAYSPGRFVRTGLRIRL